MSGEPYMPAVPDEPYRYGGATFVTRTVRTCPECGAMLNRTLSSNPDTPPSPWTCWRHGEVKPVVERYDVPTGDDDEGGYDLSDPKHPRHHEVYADAMNDNEGS